MAKKSEKDTSVNGTTNGAPMGGAITMTTPLPEGVSSVTLMLPVGRSIPTHYKFIHIDGQLSPQQSEALRILFDAIAMEAVINGTQIPRGGVDAVRFVLDKLYICYAAAGVTKDSAANIQDGAA